VRQVVLTWPALAQTFANPAWAVTTSREDYLAIVDHSTTLTTLGGLTS
jgi:hypothetical protein